MVRPDIDQPAEQDRRQIPVADGLFTWPSVEPRLVGTRCLSCGEVFFPTQAVCSNCSSRDTEEMLFSCRGILDLYTCSRYPTPGYTGPSPLCIGFIKLPEGTRIIAPLTETDVEDLRIGMEMELVVRTVATDQQGNDLMGFAFAPV